MRKSVSPLKAFFNDLLVIPHSLQNAVLVKPHSSMKSTINWTLISSPFITPPHANRIFP